MPLPHSLDNDQKANAGKLQDAGAGIMIEQKNFTAETFATTLTELLGDVSRLSSMAGAALGQGVPDAVGRLADLVEQLGRGEAASGPLHITQEDR